jgi:hypothetical protein
MFLREDQADIRVSIDTGAGLVPVGAAWKTYEGGNLEADDAKTRPGGMGREVSLGGPASRDDVTCTIQFSDAFSVAHPTLESLVGNARMKVSYTPLDGLRRPVGSSHSAVGTLKSAFTPDSDSESSDAGLYTVIMSCDEEAA